MYERVPRNWYQDASRIRPVPPTVGIHALDCCPWCPILYTKDYSEITPAYLEQVYESMLQTEYTFGRLDINNYHPNLQDQIRQYGNYWMQRITGKTWY